jgi:hypothetical protein
MTYENPDYPKWVSKVIFLIHKNWHYHTPCKNINNKVFFDEYRNTWQIEMAPVYQEVYGGNEDGKKTWAGFIFDVFDFSRENGVWVQEYAIASYCKDCNENPKIMMKGKYRGRNFYLHILLEPSPETGISEIFDVIRHEVRKPFEDKDK